MVASNLNEDVLATACQFLTDVSDVLSFSLTCSSLRPIAARRLISMRLIPLKRCVSVRNFHSFLFADAPARAPYVHAVHIDWNPSASVHPLNRVPYGQPSEASLLVEILTSCPNIETISVMIYFDEPPPITGVIGRLRKLRTFSISMHASSKAPALLRGIRAPICVLRLKSGPLRWQYRDWWNPATLEHALGHLAPTLEKLEVSRLTVDPNIIQASHGMDSLQPISSTAQYPSLRSLTMGCLVVRPLLDHLQHLFPALHGTLSIRDFVEDKSYGLYAAARGTNKLAQDKSDVDSDRARTHTWKKLDRLACPPEIFYTLALRCPIRLVTLRNVTAETRHFVTDALREHPVPHLQLSLELRDGVGILDGFIPPELAGVLKHLTLVLQYANEVRPRFSNDPDPPLLAHLRLHDLLDHTISALRPLHALTHLRVVVDSNVCHFERWTPAHSEGFVRAVRGSAFDFAGIAAALLSSAHPSLRYLLLTTDGRISDYGERNTATRGVCEEWHAARGWRVVHMGAGADGSETQLEERPGLIELADAVMETIVWNEELFASEAEEESLKRGCL